MSKRILALLEVPETITDDEFVKEMGWVAESGIRLADAKEVAENTTLSDLIIKTEDEFIAAKLWCKEDVVEMLEKEGYVGNDQNIDALRYKVNKALTECTDDDWNCISEAIKEKSSELEANPIKARILRGLQDGYVRLTDADDSFGIRCQIGEYNFYYLGHRSYDSLEKYKEKHSTEEIAGHIFDVLKSEYYARLNGIEADEYAYYVSILEEVWFKPNRYFFTVENLYGVKHVHFQGNIAYNDGNGDYTDMEWCGVYIPVREIRTRTKEELIEKLWNSDLNLDNISEDTARDLIASYFDGQPGEHLAYEDISDDTPCGKYWFDEDEKVH